MKHAISIFLFSVFFVLSGCGGGSSDSGGGGAEGTVPKSVVGTYTGTWDGSGSNANGPFTCSGTFLMTITQSGSNLVVRLSVTSVTVSPCDNAFEFSGSGTYNPTTGAISMTTQSGNTTASLNGTASEKDGQVTISGFWSTIETNSSDVIASGPWRAVRE